MCHVSNFETFIFLEASQLDFCIVGLICGVCAFCVCVCEIAS